MVDEEIVRRDVKTLAFRLPAKKNLINLIKSTGPLVAPSANPEGLTLAKTVKEAKKYFGEIDAGKFSGLPSTLIQITKNNKILVKREGAVKL
jgi:tRNA A37 threonylcarbamoyladenosine synthetase subunit TsaC/SUA5/YrdC